MAIGALQMFGGAGVEPDIDERATVDSHIRFMGSVFIAYGWDWYRASSGTPDLGRMRVLGGAMAAGGLSRLITRATLGAPHRFHDALLVTELGVPALVEVMARREE